MSPSHVSGRPDDPSISPPPPAGLRHADVSRCRSLQPRRRIGGRPTRFHWRRGLSRAGWPVSHHTVWSCVASGLQPAGLRRCTAEQPRRPAGGLERSPAGQAGFGLGSVLQDIDGILFYLAVCPSPALSVACLVLVFTYESRRRGLVSCDVPMRMRVHAPSCVVCTYKRRGVEQCGRRYGVSIRTWYVGSVSFVSASI